MEGNIGRHNIIIVLIFCLLVALPILSWADSGWKAKKTQHFTLFYREGYEKDVDEILSNLEHYREKVIELTGNKDSKHCYLTLYDAGILANGFYDPIFDKMGLFTYRAKSTEDWYRLVGVHEYTHRMHLTKTGGLPRLATTLFGTPFQPNLYTPGWIIEGITVYSESQISPYEGRLNEGYFDSYIKTRAKEKRFPDLNTITHTPFEFPPDNIYLYGGQFFQYLATRYGEDKFSLFFSSIGSSILSYIGPIFPYFSLDRAAREVYGKSTKELFSEWKRSEEEGAKGWEMEGERLTYNNGWDTAYSILYQGKLYYFRAYLKGIGNYCFFQEIVARDLSSGKEEVIVPLTSFVHTPLRIEDDKLYYGVWELQKGYKSSPDGFGMVSKVFERDLKTGKQRLLFKDEVRSFIPISSLEILYAKDIKNGFGSSIFLYSKKDKKKRLLFNTPYLISEILPTEKGIFAVAKKNSENQSIYRLEIEKGTLTPIIDTPFIENHISFEKDMLYFTANYERAYRIYAYDLKDKRLLQLTENGYADYPIVDSKTNRLYFVGLTSDGFDIFYKELKPKEFVASEYEKSPTPHFSALEAKEVGYTENLKTLFSTS